MTQDEVLNLAREADGQVTMWVNHSTIQKTTTFTFESPIDYRVSGDYPEMYHIKFLERFANLVAAKEKEALAQRTWVGLTDDEIAQGCKESWVTEQAFQSAVWWAEEKLSLSPEEAQYLETRKFSAEEIARIFWGARFYDWRKGWH